MNMPLGFWEYLLSAITTLGAAFLGAWFAFRLEDNARARQTVSHQVAAVNRGLFVLIRQVNSLQGIQKQIIDPTREHPYRFIAMRPSLHVSTGSPTLDLDSMMFLLETEDRELLMELLVEQERFETALQVFNERSRLHLEVLQPKMKARGMLEGTTYTSDTIRNVLGESFMLEMRRATDDAIEQVDETVKSNFALTSKLNQAMKKRFSKHTIIRLELRKSSIK